MVKEYGREERAVSTPRGTIRYTLARRDVRKLYLRVRGDGRVLLSAPRALPAQQADRAVRERADWIAAKLQEMRLLAPEDILLDLPPPEECRRILACAVDRMFPLACGLGIPWPELRLRSMTGEWGNCHRQQGYITLNTALARLPERLQDYVALHELVHLRVPGHGAEFQEVMDGLMPDWRERRLELKACGCVLPYRN